MSKREEFWKPKKWNDFLIDETLAFPHLLTITYFDEAGIERVDSSGYLYNNKGSDFTVPEYFAYKGREFNRIPNAEGHARHAQHLRSLREEEAKNPDYWC